MSYAAAIDQLSAMTPELFTQPGQPRRKFSLAEVRILLEALGNPQSRFPSVLIAGTNGKGSTAATLASILTESGFRTALYTSPHLERINERIRINRTLIPDDDFARLYFRIHATAETLVADSTLPQHPSFFECLTALAFLYFAEQSVDIAVLEVGMGGRLDATNIVEPLLSVITDISLDHTEWLGPTIAAITREKAGILRPRGTLVTLPQHPEANQALGEIAAELDVTGIPATPYMPPLHAGPAASYPIELHGPGFEGAQIEIASPLSGAHQHRNIALAIAAAIELANLLPAPAATPAGPPSQRHPAPPASGAAITPASIAAGIHTTAWPGRLEIIRTPAPLVAASAPPIPDPTRAASAASTEATRTANTEAPPASRAVAVEWILDVAHNPAGAWALRAGLTNLLSLNQSDPAPATLVFSCLRDKPLPEMAQILFPLFERVIFAPIHSARAASMDDLLAAAAATGTPALVADSVAQALTLASTPAAPSPAPTGSPVQRPHPAQEREAPPAPRAVVVVSGSVYLVGEARSILMARRIEPTPEPRA